MLVSLALAALTTVTVPTAPPPLGDVVTVGDHRGANIIDYPEHESMSVFGICGSAPGRVTVGYRPGNRDGLPRAIRVHDAAGAVLGEGHGVEVILDLPDTAAMIGYDWSGRPLDRFFAQVVYRVDTSVCDDEPLTPATVLPPPTTVPPAPPAGTTTTDPTVPPATTTTTVPPTTVPPATTTTTAAPAPPPAEPTGSAAEIDVPVVVERPEATTTTTARPGRAATPITVAAPSAPTAPAETAAPGRGGRHPATGFEIVMWLTIAAALVAAGGASLLSAAWARRAARAEGSIL